MMITGIAAELSWLSPILNRFSPRNRLDVTGRKMVERGLAGLGTNETIFSKMLGQGENDTLTIDQISREASNLLVAGSDTTARTTTYLIWAILADADQSIRQRIVAEVNGLEDNFSVQDALALPFLSMCIQETLRLYGAAPGALPRTTPKEGAVFQGKMVPGGCVVSTQAYTLHRNPDVFPEPLVYKPDRWASPTQDMKDAYMPFGGGTRGESYSERRKTDSTDELLPYDSLHRHAPRSYGTSCGYCILLQDLLGNCYPRSRNYAGKHGNGKFLPSRT